MDNQDLDDLRKLIELFEAEPLVELEVEEDGRTIRLRSDEAFAPPSAPPPAAAPAPPVRHEEHAEAVHRAEPLPENWVAITSPMVGVFYRAPSPDAEPYVEEDDLVEEGDVVGIIEAMKVFNEITADVSGRIVRCVAENEQDVRVDSVLFLVERIGDGD